MIHIFDSEIAKEYGLVEAILMQNFAFWIAKNEANEQNYYDGRYWTYNSIKAFQELFPYLSKRQIEYALGKLIDKGILLTGNYNSDRYNHTLWYAFSDFGKSILQKCEIDSTILGNRINNSGKSTNTDNKHRYNYTDIIEEWNNLPQPIPKVQSIKGQRETMLKRRIDENTNEGVIYAIQNIKHSSFLKGENERGWVINFDWFIKPSNFVKVMEGNYTDKKGKKLQRKPSFDISEIQHRAKFNEDYKI